MNYLDRGEVLLFKVTRHRNFVFTGCFLELLSGNYFEVTVLLSS